MDRTARVNKALADVLKGAYVTEGFTLPTLADKTHIPWRTLQRIMAGAAPITMGQLETIAAAIHRHPLDLFEAALQKADRDELSAGGRTPVSLNTERMKREAARMPDGSLEGLKHAATRKPELGADEPTAP